MARNVMTGGIISTVWSAVRMRGVALSSDLPASSPPVDGTRRVARHTCKYKYSVKQNDPLSLPSASL